MDRSRQDARREDVLLMAFLATFLFVGASRSFFATVYYQNLATLSLNATAAYALLLLAAVAYAAPAAARLLALPVVATIALAIARVTMPLAVGTDLYLPLAGIGAAAFLLLIPSLAVRARALHAVPLAGAGFALGLALDVGLVWWGASADPSIEVAGLLLVVPAGALAAFVARRIGDASDETPAADTAISGALVAGAGLGALLFVENGILAPYAVARWNGASPDLVAAASIAGLLLGAWLAARPSRWPVWLLPGANALALAFVLDHAFVHSQVLPLLVVVAQVALVLDARVVLARLSRASLRLAGLAMAVGGLVVVLLHFVAVFTFVFSYVPLSGAWDGQEDILALVAVLLVALAALTLAQARPRRSGAPTRRAATRGMLMLAIAPILAGAAAVGTPAAEVPEVDGASGFTVMSFNVHQAFGNDGVLRPALFADVLRDHAPDVVALQEADTPRPSSGNVDIVSYLVHHVGYDAYYGQPTREQAFGGAVLSRLPITEARHVALPSESDNRFFTEVKLDVDGKPVWLFAVHFGLPREDRLAQLDVLLDAAAARAGEPVVLAGDFNSCPASPCPDTDDAADDIYARLVALYEDAWVAAGFDANATAGYTYDAVAPYERIDYVFVSPEIEVIDARVVTTERARAASDHLPVLVTLRLA